MQLPPCLNGASLKYLRTKMAVAIRCCSGVCSEAVLGANVVITQSTKIIDVSGSQTVEYTGYVPPRSVVIPGSYTKHFAAGDFQVPCALIIGQRKESTDKKTSLNESLRDFSVAV